MISADSWLALLGGAQLGATMLMLGTLAFDTAFVTRASVRRSLRRLAVAAGLAALAAGLPWFLLQSAVMADADTLDSLLAAVPLVARQTDFGHTLLLRLLLTALSLGLIWAGGRWRLLAVLTTALALAAHTAITHVWAMDVPSAIAAVALHLLAAGLWLGALPSFMIAIAALPSAEALLCGKRFSWLALGCVGTIVATGLLQARRLVGSLNGLAETYYGQLVLAKISLLAIVVVLAALCRFLWLPRLRRAANARTALLLAVALETALGLGIVLIAARLAESEPSIHL